MTSCHSKLIRVGLVAISLGALVFLATTLFQREPTYRGAPLGYWLDRLPVKIAVSNGALITMEGGTMNLPNQGISVNFGTLSQYEKELAFLAVEAIGTNCLPLLVTHLGATEPEFPSWLEKWGVRMKLLNPARGLTCEIKREQALTAILRLGELARPIVPELISLSRSKDARVSLAAGHALQKIAPEKFAMTQKAHWSSGR
jgi:hypothetical protein